MAPTPTGRASTPKKKARAHARSALLELRGSGCGPGGRGFSPSLTPEKARLRRGCLFLGCVSGLSAGHIKRPSNRRVRRVAEDPGPMTNTTEKCPDCAGPLRVMRHARSRSPQLQPNVHESTEAIAICRACGEERIRYLDETRWKLRDASVPTRGAAPPRRHRGGTTRRRRDQGRAAHAGGRNTGTQLRTTCRDPSRACPADREDDEAPTVHLKERAF